MTAQIYVGVPNDFLSSRTGELCRPSVAATSVSAILRSSSFGHIIATSLTYGAFADELFARRSIEHFPIRKWTKRNHLEVEETHLDEGEARQNVLRFHGALAFEEDRNAGPVLAPVEIADCAILVQLPGAAQLFVQVREEFIVRRIGSSMRECENLHIVLISFKLDLF